MVNNYNSLSNYLNSTFNCNTTQNNIIKEDLLGNITSFFSGKKEANKKLGFFGAIGAMLGSFTSKVKDTNSSKNPFLAEYTRQVEDEAKREQKRLENELNAEDKVEIARLKAEYEHRQRQLDLASQNKVKAYNATERRLKDAEKKVKTNKLLYSAAQNEALITKIRTEGAENSLDSNPLKQMQELALLIYMKPDGSVRSGEELKAELENENSELKQYVEEYNKIADKFKKPILDSMNTEDFIKEHESMTNEAYTNSTIETELEDAINAKKSFEKGRKAFNAVKEMQDEYDKIGNEITKIDNFFNSEENPNGDTIKTKLNELLGEELNLGSFNNGDQFDATKFGARLESLGIPSDIIDKIKNSEGVLNGDADSIKAAINGLESKDIDEIITNVKNKKEELEKKQENSIDMKSLTLEEQIAKINKVYENDEAKRKEMVELVTHYHEQLNQEDIEKGLYNEEIEASQTYFDNLTADVKKAETRKQKLKDQQEANRIARQKAETAIKYREENAIPDSIKDDVENQLQGLEGDEQMDKDGNIYFMDGDEPVYKPVNGSEEEQNKYIERRNKHLLSIDLENYGKGEGTDYYGAKKIEVNPGSDPETYTITYADGTQDTNASKDDAIFAKTNQLQHNRSRQLILSAKQEMADTLNKYISDGELKMDEIEALRKSTKPEDQLKYEMLAYCIENSDNIETFFNGVDLIGNDTLNSIKTAFKKGNVDNTGEIKAKMSDDYEKYDVAKNSSDWEDENDADADDDEETDSDEEDEVNAKNEAGDSLVKIDGKWYKTDDVDDEGNLKSDAKPQTNVSNKKIKNPAKEWKRRKRKNGKGTTKNYYNKKNESISEKEYKERMFRYNKYKKAKTKQQQPQEEIQQAPTGESLSKTLSNILEFKHTRTVKYTELRNRLLEMFG